MQVRASRRSGIPHPAHDIALLDRELIRFEKQVDAEALTCVLFFLHTAVDRVGEAEQMPVDRSRAVGMLDVQTVSIAPGRNAHPGDVAALDGVDRVADLSADPPVHSAVEMVVPQLAIGAGKRHRHIERPYRLLLCQCTRTYHQCAHQNRQPLHCFGVNDDEFRQPSTISFSLRSSRLGTYTCT